MTVWAAFLDLLHFAASDPLHFLLALIPFVLFFEMPLYVLIFIGNLIHFWEDRTGRLAAREYSPSVSCIVTCYNEGEAVKLTFRTLFEQLYDGPVEVIAVIDGSIQNAATLRAAQEFAREHGARYPLRRLRILPKFQRGGRVSSLNSGLMYATGEIVMALDGDTSFENDMIRMAVRHFANPKVCAVSGSLSVRNAGNSLVARLQQLEYLISLVHAKTGLSSFNIVNNISGAFGVFRRSMLDQVGGWSAGTAEDLDITLRIKQYIRRTGCIIGFEPFTVGRTDAPESWVGFCKQRLRWDGDLGFLYLRKHLLAFSPSLVGWPNFIMLIWNGLFFQIAAPFIILIYTGILGFLLPFPQWVALNLFIASYYLGVSTLMLLSHLLLTSRNRRAEAWLMLLLPLFGLYTYFTRLWSCVALLNEWLRRGHEESGMAPWWVLRRTRY